MDIKCRLDAISLKYKDMVFVALELLIMLGSYLLKQLNQEVRLVKHFNRTITIIFVINILQ